MDDSRLGSIDLDYGDSQPKESNTGATEVSDDEQSDDGLRIPKQLRTTGIVEDIIRGLRTDQPIATTNNETQFSPDENEVIEQLMTGAIPQDLDAHVMSSTAGDEGVWNQSIHLTADLTGSKRSAKEAFRPARPESPPPAKKIVLTRDDPITELCLCNLDRINLESQASISALQEKNSELERQLLEAKQSYDSMLTEGRDIIAQKNHEIKDNELKLDEVKKSLVSTKQQYNARIAEHEQCRIRAEAYTDTLIEDLKQSVEKNGMPTLKTAVEVAKPHVDEAMRQIKLHYEKRHEEIKRTAAATQAELQSLRADYVTQRAALQMAGMHLKNQVQTLGASLPHFQGVTKSHGRATFRRQLDGSAGSRIENPYSSSIFFSLPAQSTSETRQSHQGLPLSSFTVFHQQEHPQRPTFTQQQPQLPPKPQSSVHQQQQPSTFAYQQPQPSGYQMTFTQQQVPSLFEAHQEPQSSAHRQQPPPPTFTPQLFGHQQPPPPMFTQQQQPSTFAYEQPQPSEYQTTPTQQQGPSSFEAHQDPQSSAFFSRRGVGKWPGATPLNSSNQGHPQRNDDLSNSDSGEEGDSSDAGNRTKKMKKKKKKKSDKAIHTYQRSLLLSIKTDKDVHSAVSRGCYTNLDQANAYKSGDWSTLPSLSPLCPCWEHINHDWNFTLKDLFVAGFISIQKKKHPEWVGETQFIGEHFMQRLSTLRQSLGRYLNGTLEHSNMLYEYRLQFCMNNNRQEAFLVLFHILETCSAVYMSSDESGDESVLQQYGLQGKHVMLVRRKEWRSSEVLQLLKWLDCNQATVSRTASGCSRAGAAARIRLQLSDRHAPKSSRPPLAGLPINFYNTTWLQTLTPSQRQDLHPVDAIGLPMYVFTWRETSQLVVDQYDREGREDRRVARPH
ncbi:hypothetical protein IW261DRAFT_1423542 [Armillaria novae-zelandiae]|uniref:Uncharacterized protein n=1 Tax=Armillaria novae-zelandiae TaxID=153914 RepID=A0AA39NXF2_9AGAR|nr:hypothetical protein IW261DRAFT_1423542 [Armillaria novae-zelandiae]